MKLFAQTVSAENTPQITLSSAVPMGKGKTKDELQGKDFITRFARNAYLKPVNGFDHLYSLLSQTDHRESEAIVLLSQLLGRLELQPIQMAQN